MTAVKVIVRKTKGGPGSGNWGHSGRPGAVGGSAPSGGSGGSASPSNVQAPPKTKKVSEILGKINIEKYRGSSYDNPPTGFSAYSRSGRTGIDAQNGKYGRGATVYTKGDGLHVASLRTADGIDLDRFRLVTTNLSEAVAYADSWITAAAKFK